MKNKIIVSVILFGIMCMFPIEVISQEKSKTRSINPYYNKLGVDDESIYEIENLLLDNGIEQNNIEAVKRYVISIIKDIPSDSRKFELTKKNKNDLQKIHIKPSQMEVVKRIALRINLIQDRNKKK